MKKSILSVAVVLATTSIFAQDLTSRKGENYLPEAGDWAIGIDAVPLLNYVGNIFGKTGDNLHAGTIWSTNNPAFTINGKYFVEDNMAFRGGIRLGFGATTRSVMVDDRADIPATNPWPEQEGMVENKMRNGYTNVGLTFGIEKRKGNTRLQGFYGAELGFLVSSNSTKYTYGNALTEASAVNPVNVSGDDAWLGTNNIVVGEFDGNNNPITLRQTSEKSGVGFSLGLRAFIGAEYFIVPKLSIGGELGWGLGLTLSGKGTAEYEAVGETAGSAAGSGTVHTITREGDKTTSFGLDNALVNPLFGPVGRLNLTFHF
ncbi:MAG TPA: hypothetical protein VKZ44_04105 [Taishania sp.]|nr:hypothetical protein [Taishania sp.]